MSFQLARYALVALLLISRPAAASLAYVLSNIPNTVSVLETTSNTVVDQFSVCDAAIVTIAVNPDGSRLYLWCPVNGDLAVKVVNTATKSIVASIPVEPGPIWTFVLMAFSPDGARAYITSGPGVLVVDTATNAIIAFIDAPSSSAVTVSPDGSRAYVGMGGLVIAVIDTATNTIVAEIPTARDVLVSMVVSPNGSRLYAAQDGGSFLVIDTATNTVLTTVDAGIGALAISPDGSRLYGAGLNLLVFDTGTNAVVASVPASGGTLQIALTPDGKRLYVPDINTLKVSVIDTASNTLLTTVPFTTHPFGIAIPQKDLFFPFTGFLKPVDNPSIVNVTKVESAVPMKFSLGGNRGLNIFAPGFPASIPIPCDFSATTSTLETLGAPGSSALSYDSLSDVYTYLWKTDKSWAGCRQVILKLTDNSFHVANFQFR